MAKPKRARKAKPIDTDDDEETRQLAYTMEETIDVGALKEVATLMSLNQQVATNIASMLALYKDTKIGTITTKYYYPEPNVNDGRAFAGSPSIQGLKGAVTRLCAHSLYKEIDIVKCAPTMLLYIAERYTHTNVSTLQRYVNDASSFFEYLRNIAGLDGYLDIPDSAFKECVNSLIHTGSYEEVLRKYGVVSGPIQALEDMQNEVSALRDKCVIHPVFEKMWDACANKANRRGSFVSLIWQHIEGKAIRRLIEFLAQKNIIVSVLKHDGLLVRWDNDVPFPVQVLRDAEAFIRQPPEAIHLQLAVKALTPRKEDLDLLRGRKHLHMLTCDTARIVHCLQQHAYKHRMIRVKSSCGDVHVYKPHASIPCVLEYFSACDVFVNQVIVDYMTAWGALVTKASFDWMQHTSHEMFPLLTRECFRADVVAFPNGYLVLGKDQNKKGSISFHEWCGTESFKTRHFMASDAVGFDKATNTWALPPTPLWTSMLTYQLGVEPAEDDAQDAGKEEAFGSPVDEATGVQVRWLEAMIGRLNYDVNSLDNWQVRSYSVIYIHMHLRYIFACRLCLGFLEMQTRESQRFYSLYARCTLAI